MNQAFDGNWWPVHKYFYIYAFSRHLFYPKPLTLKEHKKFFTELTIFIVYNARCVFKKKKKRLGNKTEQRTCREEWSFESDVFNESVDSVHKTNQNYFRLSRFSNLICKVRSSHKAFIWFLSDHLLAPFWYLTSTFYNPINFQMDKIKPQPHFLTEHIRLQK